MKAILLGLLAGIAGGILWSYCGIAHGQQFGPRMDPDMRRPYYMPRQPQPRFGQPFPYGWRGTPSGPDYRFAPRQYGPPDPYHGFPRYEYFQPCRSNPWACGGPP